MKKFLVLGLALVLTISMGFMGFILFTNDGAADVDIDDLAAMIEWDLERNDDYNYEVEVDFVKYRDGETRVYYDAYIDDGYSHYGSVNVTWLIDEYCRLY